MKNYCFIIFLIPSLLFGQNEDLLQRINAFKTDHSIDYKIKSFNIGGERLGSIEYEESDFETRFKLEGRNKTKDNLDRNVRFDIYINIYEFVDQEELNWVMKRWLKTSLMAIKFVPEETHGLSLMRTLAL